MDMYINQILAVPCSIMDVRQLRIITFSSKTILTERASPSVVVPAVNSDITFDALERRSCPCGFSTKSNITCQAIIIMIIFLMYILCIHVVPKTTAYKRWNCQVIRPSICCHIIPSNRFLDGFPDPSQLVAAKLTHYSTMPHRPSDSSRPRLRLLISGDVHQNPGPATKYPCSVCTSNVTSRGVCYMCNRCPGWVHSTCYGLQNAAEYRRIKNWACSSCISPPTPPIPQLLPSPITTKVSDGDPFTILQFNTNGIGNKQVELGEFLERHKVKVAVIQESKFTLNSRTPNIQNFTTVRKYRHQGQGGGLLTLIYKSINFSRRPDSPDTLADPHLEEVTITAKLGNTDLIITNVYIPPAMSCT